ncbi:hypothetical protein LPJ56_002759 [Coemansia sp. RSA 2599]|nr:hypothetical protein LPJ56_002759 [Coemansia sp. RSA 2599]
MKAGFIAASCFDFNGGKSINTSTKYEIYIQDGSSTPIVSRLDPSDIALHPNYNPSTYENNIAVIQFNKGTTDKYIGYITSDRYLVEESAYVRRTINPSTGKWNDPVMTQMIKNQDDCSNFSGLFASNIYEIACSPYGTTSMYQSTCTVPHGTVYTRGTGIPGLIGVMSYMIVEGDSTCKGGTRFYVFYTKLWNLDRFATSVLGYPVDVLLQETPTTEPKTALYTNNSPKSIDMSGKTVFSGDFYAIQGANQSSNDDEDKPVVNKPEPVDSGNNNSGGEDKGVSNEGGSEATTKDGNDDNAENNTDTSSRSSSKGDSDSDNDNSNNGNNDNNDNSNGGNESNNSKNDDGDEKEDDKSLGGDADGKSKDQSSPNGGFEYAEYEETEDSDDAVQSAGAGAQAGSDSKSAGTSAQAGSDAESQQANAKSSDEGLGQTQIIVIAVVVPVVALLIGFISFLVFRYKRGIKEKKRWDPIAEENYHRNAVLDLGGTEADVMPPAYERRPNASEAELNLSRSSEDSVFKDVKI